MKVLMHALAASCEELRARTGNPPLDRTSCYKCNGTKREAGRAWVGKFGGGKKQVVEKSFKKFLKSFKKQK
jgi:hypothetical protein